MALRSPHRLTTGGCGLNPGTAIEKKKKERKKKEKKKAPPLDCFKFPPAETLPDLWAMLGM